MPNESIKKNKVIKQIWEHPHELGWLLGYDKLTEIHSDWIKYLYLSDEESRILAFRDSYKTTACIIIGTIWFLYFFPNNRVLNTSSVPDKINEISFEIRTCYEHTNLIKLYNLIGISEPKDKNLWRTDSIALTTRSGKFIGQSSIDFKSARSLITGQHYTHINCDDIVTLEDKLSEATRKYKREWYQNLQSVISGEAGNHIAIIGTPWHPEDIYSKDKDIFRMTKKFPIGSVDIIGFTEKKKADKKKKLTPAFYAAQYELKHISDETMIFESPNIIKEEDFPKDLKLIAYVDPAFGGKDEVGFTAGGLWNNNIYIKFGYSWLKTLDEYYNLIKVTYAKSKATKLFVENNAGQKSFLDVLRLKGLHPIGVNNSENKYIRINNKVQYNWDKIYFCETVSDEYLTQISYYQEPDDFSKKYKGAIDGLDSLAGLIAKLKTGDLENYDYF